MSPLPALRHASLGAFLALLLCSPVRADLDIGALSTFSSDSPDSPIVQHQGELYAGFGVGYIW
ncbi:hypothetical protein KAM463_18750 [Aeromonas caviae]|uniref:hypothetical protein n=1 Tax=Aeromonas TaxID=642 RepID=UPI001F3237CF|nr:MULTISPECIES: hypothetical protein [Aeromonas]GKR06310.1 hypothetical protein KAM463_18750 [Aeromonas caviae]